MGAKASTTAGSAVKRAFPTAHRAAAEAVQSKTRGALDVTRDAPIHLRAAAASAKGDLDGLDPATTSSTTTTTTTNNTNQDFEIANRLREQLEESNTRCAISESEKMSLQQQINSITKERDASE